MLTGRLGLETARVPQVDRHGLLWLGRGTITVEDGTLHFRTAGFDDLPAGDFALPFQMLSCLLMQPGTTVSHDALRVLARHGTGLVVIGEGGVRFYASLPAGPDRSARARRQALRWADPAQRLALVRRMYAWRMGEVVPADDLDTLRGIEGARVRLAYRTIAKRFGVPWRGRRYDRADPEAADGPNQAINHAATAVQAAAMVATAVTGAIPQLGFIHEDSGYAFALDIADLFRESVTLPCAFRALKEWEASRDRTLEFTVRTLVGRHVRAEGVVPAMIDRIKDLLDDDNTDRLGDA